VIEVDQKTGTLCQAMSYIEYKAGGKGHDWEEKDRVGVVNLFGDIGIAFKWLLSRGT
jgi:hypothetical protein